MTSRDLNEQKRLGKLERKEARLASQTNKLNNSFVMQSTARKNFRPTYKFKRDTS